MGRVTLAICEEGSHVGGHFDATTPLFSGHDEARSLFEKNTRLLLVAMHIIFVLQIPCGRLDLSCWAVDCVTIVVDHTAVM